MSYAPSPTWDLESILPGGPAAPAFKASLERLREQVSQLEQATATLTGLGDDNDAWAAWLKQDQDLVQNLAEAHSWAHCHASADTRLTEARMAEAALHELWTRHAGCGATVAGHLDAASDEVFEAFLAREDVEPFAPGLRHARAARELRLPPPLSGLQVEMDREALHGWGQAYQLVSGKLSAPYDGETLSVGQLAAMRADADPEVRRKAHEALTVAWGEGADMCAHILTQLTGARESRYDRLGIGPLDPSLHVNRVSKQTLDAMWAACDTARDSLGQYLQRKAQLLGSDTLDWWDVRAPLVRGDGGKISWDRAQELVVQAFGGFDDHLADFARDALSRRWVEAEDRPAKQIGGYCTGLPLARESRIFMTFKGTMSNALVLAHELGHAYHNHILFDADPARRELTPALAETASTFAEAVFRDRLLEVASPDERLTLLDAELQAAVAFLMDIRARYRFELSLFDLRRNGSFDPAVLSEQMHTCIDESFGGHVANIDRLFWASKLHFYISQLTFYNWPYTFGYLFSGAIYARAGEPGFLAKLHDVLRRTGYQSAEDIAQEALGVDLHDPAFWVEAVAPVNKNVGRFLEASEA